MPTLPSPLRMPLAAVAAIAIVAGCGGASPTRSPVPGSGAPLGSASPAAPIGDLPSEPASSDAPSEPPASDAADAQVIEVSLTDAMRIEPGEMTVKAGVPVRFEVTNAGGLEHEFFVGSKRAQLKHAKEMAGGGMMHGDENGVLVPPGETMTLEMTFQNAGKTLAGCHVNGHYAAGMKARITIEP